MEEEKVEGLPAEHAGTFGKFASAEELFRAYGELEEECARRGRRLEELEKPQDGESLYRAVSANEEVRGRIVGEYLGNLRGVPLMTGGGTGVTAPPVRARTFPEAGKLALGYFRNKNN